MRKWLYFFILLLGMLLLVLVLDIKYVFLGMLIPIICFSFAIITYKRLSNLLELKCKDEFIHDSIYLSTIDLHYLNPLSVFFRKSYSNSECTGFSEKFKQYSLMTILSFIGLIICMIFKIVN